MTGVGSYCTIVVVVHCQPSTLHTPAFEGVVLLPPFKCDEEPLNNDCHMKASLSNMLTSVSVQSFVGRACRNIMTSWKSILSSCGDHLISSARQT